MGIFPAKYGSVIGVNVKDIGVTFNGKHCLSVNFENLERGVHVTLGSY